jgi:iron(III) transport system permease protein
MISSFRLFVTCVVVALALLLALPVLTVLFSWAQWNHASAQILLEMANTVLPDYAGTSLLLCLLVSIGVVSMGTVSATAVTLFDFPMRRTLEWALLLPLAMPAYVVAYAYTDYLQFSGPLQTGIREIFGLEGRVFPEVRNVWGAACVFTLALYPYVYLLARTALSDRANHLMEAARLLGAPLSRRILHVALPLARPAIAAGTTLALMETLADYGVSSYFGIQTFTAGIYKAWLVMDNQVAAAQLATLLLLVVVLLLSAEKRAQHRLRFSSARPDRQGHESQPFKLQGTSALHCLDLVCATCAVWFCIASAVYVARLVSRTYLEQFTLGPFCAVVIDQFVARRHDGCFGCGGCVAVNRTSALTT